MLELRNKPIEELPTATARVPIEGAYRRVSGKVVGQTFETDPILDIRLASGAVVRVRQSEAEISNAA